MFADIYGRRDEFDVVHSHLDIWTYPFTRLCEVPTVLTMHGRLDLDYLRVLMPRYASVPLVSISDDQRRAVADLDLTWAATVYNGLDLGSYADVPHDCEGYLAFVGRIAEEKGPLSAIEIARRAGLPLRMAAKVDPLDEEYYEHEVKPHLGHGVDFVGEIEELQKPGFYAGARATLFPSDWPEPFGLVMIESMAAGTPVIALRRGSVPEVVVDGVTGFICDDVDQMAHAVERIGKIDPDQCRRHAQKFSTEAMCRGYTKVYERQVGRPSRPDSRIAPLPVREPLTFTSNGSRPSARQGSEHASVTKAAGGPACPGRGAAGRRCRSRHPGKRSEHPGGPSCGPGCWAGWTEASASAWWPTAWRTC